jgi:DNA mismatch endonuclease (patch repair protein)
MRGNRRRDTRPELKIRSLLHRTGFRFFADRRIQAGGRTVRPDIVFPRRKVAVFIDGCFWHGCPEHGRIPRVNSEYWSWKLEQNLERDARVTAALRTEGWHVIRIWEHTPPRQAAAEIVRILR